jgi:hypothetical protein
MMFAQGAFFSFFATFLQRARVGRKSTVLLTQKLIGAAHRRRMILRRSNVDILLSDDMDTLHRGPKSNPGNPYLDLSRPASPTHLFMSGSRQRPPWVTPQVKTYEVHGRQITHGGKELGPGAYDTDKPWVHEPQRRSTIFASNSPRLTRAGKAALTANIEGPSPHIWTQQSARAATPGWGTSPRITSKTSILFEGQQRQADPHSRSIAERTARPPVVDSPRRSPRLYVPCFERAQPQRPAESGTRVSPQIRCTTTPAVGPGTYELPMGIGARARAHPGWRKTSPAFAPPSSSREARGPNPLTRYINQPFGGEYRHAL